MCTAPLSVKETGFPKSEKTSMDRPLSFWVQNAMLSLHTFDALVKAC
jgi:hypothetical protein